eukprot:5043853-Amphidinium_carterae.1
MLASATTSATELRAFVARVSVATRRSTTLADCRTSQVHRLLAKNLGNWLQPKSQGNRQAATNQEERPTRQENRQPSPGPMSRTDRNGAADSEQTDSSCQGGSCPHGTLGGGPQKGVNGQTTSPPSGGSEGQTVPNSWQKPSSWRIRWTNKHV